MFAAGLWPGISLLFFVERESHCEVGRLEYRCVGGDLEQSRTQPSVVEILAAVSFCQ
jgi:hypothetical protein